ncbi:MAG: hypothetical protein M3Y74_10095 [Chloroflexota bacterium]|nr:hypothetical protein [Chloroflexota bacterium]
MAHANRPTPPVAASARPRALVGTVSRVTYPYLLGGGVGYLALTVVSRDIALMGAGALLVLYGAALSKAVQGQGPSGARERGTDGAQ